MDYISKLTDEELRVICDLIPVRHFREAFKMSPKRFNRLSPRKSASFRDQEDRCQSGERSVYVGFTKFLYSDVA